MKAVKITGILVHLIFALKYLEIASENPIDLAMVSFLIFAYLFCISPLILYFKHLHLTRVREDHELSDQSFIDSHMDGLDPRQKEINLYLSGFSPLKALTALAGVIYIGFGYMLYQPLDWSSNATTYQKFSMILPLIYVFSGVINLFYVIRISFPLLRPETN